MMRKKTESNVIPGMVSWQQRGLRARRAVKGCLLGVVCVFVLIATHEASLAQKSPTIEVEEQRIRLCVQSVEKIVLVNPVRGSERLCALAETWRCVRDNEAFGRVAETMRDCAAAELAVWQKLLKESYDAAMLKLAKIDLDTKGKGPGPDPEPALPGFIRAHQAWKSLAESDCEFARELQTYGTASAYTYQLCMVEQTAKRTIYYYNPIFVFQ